jgi:hypothetical protein
MPGSDVLGESSALVVDELAEHNTVDLARFGPRRRAVWDTTPPIVGMKRGRSEPQVSSDDVLAAWVLSDVSRGRARSTSYPPLMNSRRSAFILPGSTIAIPWEPPGYTFKIA